MRTESDTDRDGAGSVGVTVAMVATLLLSACASGDLVPEESCASDEDCENGKQCVADICQVLDTAGSQGRDTGGDTGRSPVDTGSPDDPRDTGPSGGGDSTDDPSDSSDSGGRDTTQPTDTAPPDCNDQCGLGEECDNGQCVSKCQPTCNTDQQCLDLGDGPQCYDNCQEAGTTQGCRGSEVLCRDLSADQSQELLVCIPSQCDTSADCQAGSCLNFINDFGACVGDGPKSIGQSCDGAKPNERCETGAFCVPEGAGSTGTCRELCDPWNPQCNSGGNCSLLTQTSDGLSFLTRRQGYCNPNSDPDGSQPFQQCRTRNNMCTHAVRCFGASDPTCIKWCRPGEGDCRGTVPSQFQARGVCHNYTFPGVRKVGRCVPDCGSSSVTCPDGYQCRSGMCRKECTSGTVANDCCGGNTPCAFECPNGFCE